MNQWAFVWAAYAVALLGVLVLALASWRAMARAEAAADAMRGGR